MVHSFVQTLPRELTERTLEKLGLRAQPEPNLDGLTQVYAAWCKKVPSDNIRLMIYRVTGATGALPADSAADFLESWLADGLGGVCWEVNFALQALLTALGFKANMGTSTMLHDTAFAYRHACLSVDLDGESYLTDGTVLHAKPQPLTGAGGEPDHHGWGVKVRQEQGHSIVWWKPLQFPDGIEFRIDKSPISSAECAAGYQEAHNIGRKRGRRMYVRILRDDNVVGIADDKWVEIDRSGALTRRSLTEEDLLAVLVTKLGFKEEVIAQLPRDAFVRAY